MTMKWTTCLSIILKTALEAIIRASVGIVGARLGGQTGALLGEIGGDLPWVGIAVTTVAVSASCRHSDHIWGNESYVVHGQDIHGLPKLFF